MGRDGKGNALLLDERKDTTARRRLHNREGQFRSIQGQMEYRQERRTEKSKRKEANRSSRDALLDDEDFYGYRNKDWITAKDAMETHRKINSIPKKEQAMGLCQCSTREHKDWSLLPNCSTHCQTPWEPTEINRIYKTERLSFLQSTDRTTIQSKNLVWWSLRGSCRGAFSGLGGRRQQQPSEGQYPFR